MDKANKDKINETLENIKEIFPAAYEKLCEEHTFTFKDLLETLAEAQAIAFYKVQKDVSEQLPNDAADIFLPIADQIITDVGSIFQDLMREKYR